MRSPLRNRGWCAVLATLVLAGCAGATQLTTVWADPVLEANSLRRPMVVGIAKTPAARRVFEDRFVAALQAQGIAAEPSYRLVGDETLDSARFDAAIHRAHCDAVFVTRVVDETVVRTYYPPTGYPPAGPYLGAPWAYGGGWYNYYAWGYNWVGTPGYTIENKVVNFETNLYRVSDGQLVWSALSREWLALSDTPTSEIDPFVRQLTAALVRSRIVTGAR